MSAERVCPTCGGDMNPACPDCHPNAPWRTAAQTFKPCNRQPLQFDLIEDDCPECEHHMLAHTRTARPLFGGFCVLCEIEMLKRLKRFAAH